LCCSEDSKLLLLTALGGKILKILQMRKQNCQKGGSYPRVPVVWKLLIEHRQREQVNVQWEQKTKKNT
jgi:hypothetical protein